MKYNQQQLLEILKKTIAKNKRHKHYNHVVALSKYYRQLMTGENQDNLILSYKPRETDEQKEQRVKITNSRTQYVSNKVVSVFKKVTRVDNIVDNLHYEQDQQNEKNETKAKIQELRERMKNFHNGLPLRQYAYESFEHLSFFDPNAFVVVDFRKDPQGKEKPFTYPVEIASDQAIMYEWADGELQYVIAQHKCAVPEKPTERPGEKVKLRDILPAEPHIREGDRYLLYAPDFAIELRELAERKKAAIGDEWFDAAEIIELSVKADTGPEQRKRFAVRYFETKSKVTPAMQVGYIRDPRTNRETFVSPLDPADKVFRDLINTKSEYDLAKALHGFLQKIQYAPVCDFEREVEATKERCQAGKMSLSNDTCPGCQGLGVKIHKTVQDAILVEWPDSTEQFYPLSQAVHYVEVPAHIMEMWKKEVADLERDVSFAIFNTNLFDRSEIAVTATEKRINQEAAYDVMSDYADQLSEYYKFLVKLTAIHTQNDDNLVIDHKFPRDFRLEAPEELLAQRKLAVDSGAPYAVLQSIDLNIISKQSQDDPSRLDWVKVREKFRPFREKSKEEKMFIIADLPPDHPKKVLYIHFEEIMDMIEEAYADPPFHRLTFAAQRKILEEAIAQFLPDSVQALTFRETVASNANGEPA